jgi:hypothetical protein
VHRVWSFLGQADATLVSFSFSPVWRISRHLDSVGRKISQLEEAIGRRLEEEGRALAWAVVDNVLMCFQCRDPGISLEPVVQGPVEGSTEAGRVSVEDVARVVAEWFEREPKDVEASCPVGSFLLFLSFQYMTLCRTLLTGTSLILHFLGSWHHKDPKIFFLKTCRHFFVKLALLVVVVFTAVAPPGRCHQRNTGNRYQV